MLRKDYTKAKLNPDKPIELTSEDDKLSFNKIVDSVIDLLKLPERPFTFGLFGKWGTGKSTILGEVEKRLDGEDYYVVTFDAWKYEGDALRRSFLISIADQLNAKIKPRAILPDEKVLSDELVEALKENTYKDKSEPQVRPNISFLKLSLFIGGFFLLLAAEIALTVNVSDPKNNFIKISPLLLAFVMGLAAFIVNAVSPSSIGKLLVKEINIGTDKLSSPEEFYEEFLNILKEIKGKTLLVIIDNLDRTQKEATVELLGTIKTFLNSDRGKEDVIFLVASDHKAIKRHIKEVYSSNKDDAYEAEEFIKKFFNAVIEIPPFISSEYRAYLIDLLDQSGIEALKLHKENMISIISAGYPDNPRGAKQFVNSLVVYLVMLSSIGHKAGIEQEFIENNLNFIASLLVIRDRFDEVYDDIQEQSLQYEHSWDEIKKSMPLVYTTDEASNSKRRDFKIFYDSVESWVSPESDSLKWFFNMRRSAEEQKLPNWDAFVSSVDKKDQEQAIKYLQEFSGESNTLNILLEQHIRNIKNETSRWTSFCAVFLGYLTRTNPTAVPKLQGAVRETFRFFPKAEELAKFTNQISCRVLIELLSSSFVTTAESAKVRTAINGYLRSGGASDDAVLEIVQAEAASKIINASTVKAISAFTRSNESFYEAAVLLNSLVQLDARQEFISSEATRKVVQSLMEANLSDDSLLFAKLSFVKASRFVDKYIADRYVELMTWLQNGGNDQNRSKSSIFLYDFLRLADSVSDVLEAPNIQNITQYVMSWYQQNTANYAVNRNYAALLALLSHAEGNAYTQNARELVRQFVGEADVDDLVFLLEKLEPTDQNRTLVLPKLYERILRETSLFNTIGAYRSKWLSQGLSDLAAYLVINSTSLASEEQFINAINLSKDIIDRIDDDSTDYEEKLYEALDDAVDKFTDAVSSYVYKVNDNILQGHHDWQLRLKRKIREIRDQEKEEG